MGKGRDTNVEEEDPCEAVYKLDFVCMDGGEVVMDGKRDLTLLRIITEDEIVDPDGREWSPPDRTVPRIGGSERRGSSTREEWLRRGRGWSDARA